jgi:Uma2 family endonuclease
VEAARGERMGSMSGSATARRLYDWNDYRSWPDDQRWEIIGGEAFAMTPAPTTRHQRIVHELDRQMGNYFAGKPCQVFPAPTDVRLSDRDVVQPDLAVVCEPEKVRPTHIEGAPTLVVEVLSPSTAAFDRVRKLAMYARSGVREVWLITPYPWLAEVLVLDGDSYRLAGACEKGDVLVSRAFPDLKICLEDVFSYPIDEREKIEMVREVHPPYAESNSGKPQ